MRRIGVLPYLALWGVLMALQCAAVYAMLPWGGSAPLISMQLGAFALALLQGAKLLPTAWRLYDLGRPSDNAIMTLIPLVNIGLFMRMLSRTPKDKIRNARLKKWQHRTLAIGALRNGLKAMTQGAAIAVPLCIVWGVVAGLNEAYVGENFNAFVEQRSETQTVLFQGGLATCAFLLLYLVMQLFKRKKASRNSWLPTLLILPAMLITIGLIPGLNKMIDPRGPAAMAYHAVAAGWWILAGAFFYVRWVALGHDLREHGKVELKRANALYKERIWAAVVPHGGVSIAIWVGMQILIIPGLVYALIMAFVVHVVVLDPDKAPFRRSARLSTANAMRIFNVIALGFLLMLAAQATVLVGTEFVVFLAGGSTFVLEDGGFNAGRLLAQWAYAQPYAGAIPLPAVAVGAASAASTFIWGCVMAGLVWVYHERVAEMSGKKKAGQSTASAEAARNAGPSPEADLYDAPKA